MGVSYLPDVEPKATSLGRYDVRLHRICVRFRWVFGCASCGDYCHRLGSKRSDARCRSVRSIVPDRPWRPSTLARQRRLDAGRSRDLAPRSRRTRAFGSAQFNRRLEPQTACLPDRPLHRRGWQGRVERTCGQQGWLGHEARLRAPMRLRCMNDERVAKINRAGRTCR